MAVFVPRTIINGGLLRSFISQNVSLIVHVEEEVALQSRSFVGKTTDDVTVTIQLDDPLNVQVKGWIEVIGVPSGADTIRNKEVGLSMMMTLLFQPIVKYRESVLQNKPA